MYIVILFNLQLLFISLNFELSTSYLLFINIQMWKSLKAYLERLKVVEFLQLPIFQQSTNC